MLSENKRTGVLPMSDEYYEDIKKKLDKMVDEED
jgi:hypothetical protein